MSNIWNAPGWIWLAPGAPAVNSYIDFRKEFELGAAAVSGTLQISAIGDFFAMLDGVPIGRGQFSDYPDAPTFSTFTFDGAFAAGRHVLAITGYRRGADFSTFRDGPPGLCARLELGGHIVVSGTSWRARENRCYRSGEIERITGQLGFAMQYDARNEDGWALPGFDDSGWTAAEAVSRPAPVARPVPPQTEGPRLAGKIVSQGRLLRLGSAGTFAEQVRDTLMRQIPGGTFFALGFEFGNELLPMPGAAAYAISAPAAPENGSYVIVDLGGEKAGLLEFELDAPAGTVLDISHGEHLTDGRVRTRIGSRNFTDRYVCKAGRNAFKFPFRRFGARYLELAVTGTAGTVELRYLGLRPLTLELPEEMEFDNGDALEGKLRSVAVNTLKLCMHEHYEDCPWREQALYAYDSRNQALYGYQVWGNYAFARAGFELLGRGLRPDMLLELCAPARCGVTIPIFSFAWIIEVEELGRYSGDDGLFRQFAPQMEAMLRSALDRFDPFAGLARPPEGKQIWHFYEWVPGLDGTRPLPAGSFSAPYNLYLLLALRSYEAMCRRNNREVIVSAPQLGEAIRRNFHSEADGCFLTFRTGDGLHGLHEHTNALILVAGLADKRVASGIRQAFRSGKLVRASTSPLPFVIDALMGLGADARAFAARRIQEEFSPMLFTGHDTLWETARGESDFDGAGSLCHAWSSVSVYFNAVYELGIFPLEPGFRRFRVAPYPGRHTAVSGAVPTPSGPIAVKYRRGDDGLELAVDCPSECVPELTPFPEFPVARFTVNGKLQS